MALTSLRVEPTVEFGGDNKKILESAPEVSKPSDTSLKAAFKVKDTTELIGADNEIKFWL